ncbi:MAG: glutathione synthetase [Candidatus Xenolissoclinum pacificiensis L6]|uniref:Glutathione synthetase n=1 Tax=Candidatus Xenolissoclinum pacificiensis L6 TaxID=1401685 RepID=W2V0N3_9RICK|nr:MAG: glutathione synthetase [Candidatus Xenolissoclinum pacificiensis L6]
MIRRVLFFIDRNIDVKTDNTVLLLKESLIRGYSNYVVECGGIYVKNNITYTISKKVISVNYDSIVFESYHNTITLDEYDIVFIRKDPPFDSRYITYLYLLRSINTMFINDPISILNSPEKIFPFYSTPTIISERIDVIVDFIRENQDVIVKPLYSFGGDSIIFLNEDYPSLKSILKIFNERYNSPFLIQKYDPLSRIEGDIRVLLLDGEILGFFKRDKAGDIINNIHVGGRCYRVNLSEKTIMLCKKVSLFLKEQGINFAGIDIIGDDNLIEINVTSPMGLYQINDLYGISSEKISWDCFEKLYAKFRDS